MSDAKQMITEDQLKKIQDFQKDLNKLLNEVGFLEAQKSQVLGKFGEINKETEDFKKELSYNRSYIFVSKSIVIKIYRKMHRVVFVANYSNI